MPCVEEHTVLSYLRQRQSEPERVATEEHLDECASCRRLVSELARSSLVETPEEPNRPIDLPTLAKGDLVGRYVTLEWIGDGAMGTVYAAYDPELDRKIAIKLLRGDRAPAGGLDDSQAELVGEAKIMARLSHPHVVAVYDVGTFAGRVFLAMELVEGDTLNGWLAARPRTWQEVYALFLRAGEGLAAAHAAGLVHRDFKPDNLLVGENGRVRVSDFGLARKSQAPEPEKVIAGTPAYMAPEQARGQAADALSDQFSFCVALYEALYGERPFAASEQLAGLCDYGPLRNLPKKPSVPGWLRRIVLRGLSIAPEGRFPSMALLLRALTVRPRFLRRLRVAAAGAALLAGAVVVGTHQLARLRSASCHGMAQHLAGVWDPDTKRAIERAFKATGMPFAESAWRGSSQTIEVYVGDWLAMRTALCETTFARGQLSEDLIVQTRCLDRRLLELKALTGLFAKADAKVVEKATESASALYRLSGCQHVEARSTGRASDAVAAQDQAFAITRRLARVKALQETGQYPEALESATLAAAEARTWKLRPLEAEALYWAGALQCLLGDARTAEDLLTEAFVIAEEAGEDEVAALACSSLEYVVGYQRDRSAEAERWYRLGTAAIARLGGDDPIQSNLLSNRSVIKWVQSNYDEALASSQEALALTRRFYGGDHLRVALNAETVGVVLSGRGEYELAEPYFRQAVAMNERLLGPDHPQLALALDNLGATLLQEGEYDESESSLRRALAIFEKSGNTFMGGASGHVHLNLCLLLEKRERSDEAEVQCLSALADKNHSPFLPEIVAARGRIYLAKHDRVRGFESLERALTLAQSRSSYPLTLAEIRFDLARALWDARRDRPRALRLAGEARDAWEKAGVRRKRAEAQAWISSRMEGPEQSSKLKEAARERSAQKAGVQIERRQPLRDP